MPTRKRVFRYNKRNGEVEEVRSSEKVRLKPQWPLRSDAFAVSPEQVDEANSTMEGLGLKPNFVRKGSDVGCYEFESARHRKETGMHPSIEFYDRNGGYGDPMPPHRRGYDLDE